MAVAPQEKKSILVWLLGLAYFVVFYCNFLFVLNIFFRLIAIGLEQFEEYVTSRSRSLFQASKRIKKDLLLEVMKLISAYMMPCKDPKQLFFHVRKARWINSNPVQVGVIVTITAAVRRFSTHHYPAIADTLLSMSVQLLIFLRIILHVHSMIVALPVGRTEVDFISHLCEDTFRPVLKNNVVFVQTFSTMEKKFKLVVFFFPLFDMSS